MLKRCGFSALLALGVTMLVGWSVAGGVGPLHAEDPNSGPAQPSGEAPAGTVHVVYPGRAVGTLGGTVAVGTSGGLSWTTALKVVPGVNGLQPGLSVAYTGGGYGGLGVGFSLSAGGAISRCRATIGQDAHHAPVSWTQTDALCLGEDRLVAVTGAHGAHGTQYRLQSAPTVRVVAEGDSTASGSHFDVYTPDGRVTRYGGVEAQAATQWARIGGQLVPLAWHVAFVGDASKNFMRYRYTGEAVAGEGVLTPADHRLIEIGYGENPIAGTPMTRQVLLTYVPVQTLLGLPNDGEAPAAIHQGYVSGMADARHQVLTDIEMRVSSGGDWSLVRSYALRYESVPKAVWDTNKPDRVRLATLAECAEPIDGGNMGSKTLCFPPTRFAWSAGASGLESKDGFGIDGVPFYPLPPADELETTPYQRPAAQVVGDFDGDGDADFLVAPECMNGAADACADARWELWPMDAQIAKPVTTNVPAWSATAWTSRAGTVLPAQGVAQVWNFNVDEFVSIAPEPVLTGRRRDDKATPGAFAINYDGSYGTDVLVGEPVTELAGALMDTPWGLGSKTVTRRGPGNDAPEECFSGVPYWQLGWVLAKKCAEYPAKSQADYTAHPGILQGLKVLRLRPGSEATFEETSLHYADGRPLLWVQPLDLDGDGLTDLMFCKADADYAAVAGQLLPMFYAPDTAPVNWVSGKLHYAMNLPGTGLTLADGGTPMGSGVTARCHFKDATVVTDLYGDGRESLLHYGRISGEATSIDAMQPFVPAGTVQDPYPHDVDDADLTGYWHKLREWTWAKLAIGTANYHALTYQAGKGVVRTQTGLPFEHFMRWQQSGNTRARYSTHQASDPANPDGGWDGKWDMRDGRLTDWGDPGRPMTGMGPSEMRQGDVNGDGLTDVLRVDFSSCFYGTDELTIQDAPVFKARACSFQDVTEFGGGLLEQTFEKLDVVVYLNRGDGTYAEGDSLRLWDTDMPSAAHWEVLYQQYTGNAYNTELYAEAWTAATAATRGWRIAFGSSLMGDGNGDGLADLGLLQLKFHPNGGWTQDSMSGVYEMKPVWHLGRRSGALSSVATPMGIGLDALVPASAKTGWPGWERTGQDTIWSESGDAYASTVTPYEQQAHGMAARLMMMDVDHDGRSEFMFYDHVRGAWEFASPQAMPQPQAELLTAVTDGLGARTQVDYAPQWTLTSPAHPWTLADLTLPYPLVSRPSAAAAVALLHTDTGSDDGDQPLYTTTGYLYGKTRYDVLRGVPLGIDRRTSSRWVPTPGGAVNSLRTERYDTTSAYDPVLKAYPRAGALLSETTMVWGEAGEAVAITHGGYAYSGQPGIAPGTWRRQLDATSATSFEVGADVPGSTAGTLYACLVEVYDGAQDCVLGDGVSHQPLSSAQTKRQYDDYGYVQMEVTASAGSTMLTQRALEHRDTLNPASAYVLGLPTLEWVAHEPQPGFGYTVRTVANDYDLQGRLQKTTLEPDRPAYRFMQTQAYDSFGHVKTNTRIAQGQPDAVTSTTYSPSGAYPASTTNAAGHTTSTTWYEGCGMPEHERNVLGQTVVHAIDTFCRDKGSRTYFGAQPLTRQTNIAYREWQPDANEAYLDVELHVEQSVEGGARVHTLADRTGKVLVSQAPGLGFEVYTQTKHDVLGRVIATSLPTKVGSQPLGWTTSAYDARGRAIKLTKPDGHVQTTHYARHTTSATDELGHTGRSQVNALGQVVTVTPPADPKLPGVDLSMCYAYGAYGTLLRAQPCTPTAAKGPSVLTYDDYGRLLSSHDAQAGGRTMRYDALGRLDESEDALGQVTKHRYDVLDRMIERIQAYGTPAAKSATWTFEPATGVLAQAVNAAGTVVEVPLLDDKNRPAGMATTVHGRTYTTHQTYDAWGRIASQRYPSLGLLDLVSTQTNYNALDQVIGLTYQNQTVWAPEQADAWGHLTEQRYGNGLRARASYEPDTGRLSEAKVYRQVQQGEDLNFEQALQHFTYTWTPTGLIERRINKAVSAQQTEQFDQFYYTPRGELDRWMTIGAQQQVLQQAMSYDGFGNITQGPSGAYAYQGERLQHIDGPLGKLNYLYDDNGQVTARIHPGGVTQLHYDALNQVEAIGEPQAKLVITYNADGRKVHVQDTLTGRETTYVGAYQEERGGALGTAVIGRYALGPVHLTRTWNTKQGQLSFTDQLSYLTPADHLGSTTLVTSDKGEIEEVRSYGVWGDEREPDNWIAFKAAPKADLTGPNSGYTGAHERRRYGAAATGISGLIDMQARYYDATAGRFMAPDTIVPETFNPLSWNRYTYVDNSPVAFSDPTGHAKEGEIDLAPHLGDFWDGMTSMVRGMGGGLSEGTGLYAGLSGAIGIVGRTSALAAKKSNASKSSKGRDAFTWSSELSGEEKFWVQAYRRDRDNYERAGMKAPFESVDEYMTWRAMSQAGQALGVSSQMMDEMANTAEQEQGRFMGGAEGGVKGGIRAAANGDGPKWWWTRAARQALEAAEAARSAKKAAAAARAVDLAAASKQGQLWIETKGGKGWGSGPLRMYGDEIGQVYNFGTKNVVVLDCKYASVENAKAAWAAVVRDLKGKTPHTQLTFQFGTDAAAAYEFKQALIGVRHDFTPTNTLRALPQGVGIGVQRFQMDNAEGTLTYSVNVLTYELAD